MRQSQHRMSRKRYACNTFLRLPRGMQCQYASHCSSIPARLVSLAAPLGGRPAVIIGIEIIEFDDFAVIRCHGITARPFDVHNCLLAFPPPAQGPPTERVRHTALRGERIARRATLINVGSAHV